ncbi:PBP1A family penicillin-binding protein [Asticcacaulis sp. EMRT-3]|uniref:transglycosylase domain-containing protein n=1 Tax=Asticcacaulis sp. EMRT-3 TaxID=3040349 RepID=UPI0024AEC64D|nr:PBP1A family penicillin-binding protein [Asticcacaulis sp. EMRT-3]MDI7775971.1 PBP1A family penicillin-binding protein [Asticcacaulis sp. EMRT-3]
MAKGNAPQGGKGRGRRTPLQALLYWGTVITIWVAIFGVAFLGFMAIDLPDTSTLDKVNKQPSITYLDRSGALIAVRGSQASAPVDIDKLPDYVPLAFVAVEDKRFFTHPGFDPIGMARGLIYDIFLRKKGGNLAGGSTITQQLARNLFLSSNQNIKRKVQELMLAVWLEHKYTKKQILALYLNRVYFGAGAYGIEAASQRYFNKPAKDLSIGEAAMLAGLMKAPNSYSPLSDQERAGKRALIVLNEMVEARVITPEQRDQALHTPINVSKTLASAHAQYFVDWLDTQIRGLIDPKNTDDLIVETTLDLPIQTDAERAVQTIMPAYAKRGVEQAALVSVDGEGRIRAMIGGVSYADSQYNRATMARRQTGSSFKPFVYLTAMEAGYQPSTPVVDEPFTLGTWSPQNYERNYLGLIDLQTALQDSINTVAARLANDVGQSRVAATAHRLGITSPINTDPAMALGTSDASPLEMAQAYVPFSNGGYRAEAHGIVRIRTTTGKVLYQYRDPAEDGGRVRVINNPPLMEMNQMLRAVMHGGTGTGAAIPGYDLAGKTGTTSDFHDAWFDGYTGGFVTVVWVGRDDNTAMRGITGGMAPAAIWKAYMTSALKRIQVSPIPDGPPATGTLNPVAEDALRDLLGSQADAVQASQAANDNTDENGLPPVVTMQPIPNPGDNSSNKTPPAKNADPSLDDIFSQAQKKAQ